MQDIGFIFCPKSIAIVGASSNPDSRTNQNFLKPLLDCGYQGKIYPVNPYLSEVMGLRAYASILDIAESVDYVICAIPVPLTPKLMQDCAAARVKVVTFFTSGFSETGEEEGVRLERELVRIAGQSRVRIIGPNCLGIHSPQMGVTFEPCSMKGGHVGFLSQSGGNARELIIMGAERGIHFSKAVSYGNAADLNESDFLEHFAHDQDTEIIVAYIEGIKQPRRFLRVLGEATEAKPVIVLKGGKTEAGEGAVASHTGALAGSNETWDALCRQRRVIQVHNLEEMADTILAFSYLRPPRGRRIGIMGIGGGASVQAADDCENASLTVPPFHQKLRRELRKFTPPAGTGLRNPVDTSPDVYWDPSSFARTAQLIADDDGVDVLFVMLNALFAARRGVEALREQIEAIMEVGQGTDKPLALVLRTGGVIEAEKLAHEVQRQCLEVGFPVYVSVSRAARAMNHFISYHENRGL